MLDHLYRIILPVIVGLLVLPAVLVTGASARQPVGEPGVAYSLVYIIHGDSGYLYHNGNGKAVQADKKVLEEAKSVGREATQGEVLIFHQRPEKRILGIFPRKDRHFLHYRRGTLVHGQRYSPDPDTARNPYLTESRLYHRYRAAGRMLRSILYFGHEIPEYHGRAYHHSQQGRLFSDRQFERGIAAFASSRDSFDLAVLSTCNNGTPRMASLLSPHAKVLLASPQNLHLSHIDTRALGILEQRPGITPVDLADTLAKDTFRRLSNEIQTVISLSIYPLNERRGEIVAASERYAAYRTARNYSGSEADNVDCRQLPFFDGEQKGLKVYYRTPRFGRAATVKYHSGWGCKANAGDR